MTVSAGSPNVIFTVQPSAVVTGIGERLEDQKTTFTLENIGRSPVDLQLAQLFLDGAPPFFSLSDPNGGGVSAFTLVPGQPNTFEVRYSGPSSGAAGTFAGVITVLQANFQPLAIAPFAYVNLKIGDQERAAPEFLANGVSTEYVLFPSTPAARGLRTARPCPGTRTSRCGPGAARPRASWCGTTTPPTAEYKNVLEQLFGLTAGQKSQGPLFVESTLNGIVYSKVYSVLDHGTLGDGFPIVAVPSEVLTGGGSAKPVYVDGLEQSTNATRGTRTNLILNEVLGQPASVKVSLYEAENRTRPIAEKELSLAPLEKVQLSTVFRELGLDADDRRKDRTNVQCVVIGTGGAGPVSAIVTTIDNRTGDTKNALLSPNGGTSATGGPTFGY